ARTTATSRQTGPTAENISAGIPGLRQRRRGKSHTTRSTFLWPTPPSRESFAGAAVRPRVSAHFRQWRFLVLPSLVSLLFLPNLYQKCSILLSPTLGLRRFARRLQGLNSSAGSTIESSGAEVC